MRERSSCSGLYFLPEACTHDSNRIQCEGTLKESLGSLSWGMP